MTRLTQAQVEEAEYRVFTYREEHFKIAARVDISRLVFDKNFKRQMSNRQNIARLERILDTQGCHRLMEECHVPVLVPESDWQRRVRPRLVDGQFHQLDVDIDYQLRGQDHENLIIAARKKLSSSNSWWIVDVYVTEQTGASRGRYPPEYLCLITFQMAKNLYKKNLSDHSGNASRMTEGLRMGLYMSEYDIMKDISTAP